MDYTNTNNCVPWEMEWQGDDCCLQSNPHLDISTSLWDEVNQNEDSLLYMFDETTPVKACSDFNYHVFDNDEWYSGNLNKESEECRESIQLKRRRMLQFNSSTLDPFLCDEQMPTALMKSKDGEQLLEDVVPEDMHFVPSFSDDRSASGFGALDQSPERFLATCFNDNEMHFNSDEMNDSGTSYDQVEISGQSNTPPVMQSDMIQEPVSPAPRSIFKVISGRKSYMRTPTKLASSVAYPFALIKPCGVQGDVTLKDINQRIRTPPPPRSKKEDEEFSPSYPTSAFSGKPVVVKTKIRTEGGKGSITIMRTKG